MSDALRILLVLVAVFGAYWSLNQARYEWARTRRPFRGVRIVYRRGGRTPAQPARHLRLVHTVRRRA